MTNTTRKVPTFKENNFKFEKNYDISAEDIFSNWNVENVSKNKYFFSWNIDKGT